MATLPPETPFGTVMDRDEAETYWRPAHFHGTMNTIPSPRNRPSDAFSLSTRTASHSPEASDVPHGQALRSHVPIVARSAPFNANQTWS